ncbi:MAG: hypothetical protein MUF06_15880 [Pirellulaceae bacterium]|nr:hypothetical protein [Pirellulaceae bacterium]
MFSFETVRRGQRVALWNPRGEVRLVDGPRRLFLFRERVEHLRRYSAESHQYLAVRYADGRVAHLRGPADLWFDPVEHLAITVEESLPIDAHEALVVYQRQKNEVVARRILRGPAQYVPQADEWLHDFCWHGADPRRPERKIPRALSFQKLRVIPDQMYFDVHDARTADDALLVIKLMVFFELSDIERMLDQTHDPIADFINALSADIVDFAVSRSFEQFKEETSRLNDLAQYSNLVSRAARIGYQINKVVYRGYAASDKLQAMHDHAIEARTGLKLEAETERQAQELADLKLAREAERDEQRREMERAQTEHEVEIEKLQSTGQLARREETQKQELAHQRELKAVEIAHLEAKNTERLRLLREMQTLDIDLTRYLVSQHQHPDRLIRVDGVASQQVHLHDN